MRTVRGALAVASKDLAVELRTKESVNAAASFAVVILLLFSFAFDPNADTSKEIAGGLLWLVFVFAGALVFNRGFARELPNECLDSLLCSPLSGASLLLGKAVTTFALLLVIELVALFVFGIFYGLAWWTRQWWLLFVCVSGTWGISIIGAVFGALTVNLRLRELMLPVIIYPLLLPQLMAATELTNTILSQAAFTPDRLLWARVSLVFDLVFTVLAMILAEPILVN